MSRFTNPKFRAAIIGLAFLSSASIAFSQNAPARGGASNQTNTGTAPTPRVFPQTNPEQQAQERRNGAPEAPSGPAPKQDLWGMWNGPNEALLSNRVPEMTPVGRAKLDANIPDPFSESSNDPWKYCDPFGMPRMMNNQAGQIGFAQMPGRIILINGFNRAWREIWMDGRQLPKNVGHDDGPSAMYNGYSVGHWEGDTTLVIETVGMDEKTWMDRRGYPHSVDAKVIERYTRTDADHMSMTETIDDPVYYTKNPFLFAKQDYRLVKVRDKNSANAFSGEQICIPSQNQEYMNLIGHPADIDGATGQKKK
jgi:hypothetical protein